MVPKNIALAGPERAALVLGPPIWAFVTVLRPVVRGDQRARRAVLRLVGVRLEDEVSSTYTREEVAALVEESRGEGLLAQAEYDRLAGALGFTEKTIAARDHDPRLAAHGAARLDGRRRRGRSAPRRATAGSRSWARTSRWWATCTSRTSWSTTDRRHRPIDDKWIRPFADVGEGDLLRDALETLQRRGAHMARVVDPTATLLGLVTLEDVIEELVGQIRDAAHQDESHHNGAP